jgi:hypothetical protein
MSSLNYIKTGDILKFTYNYGEFYIIRFEKYGCFDEPNKRQYVGRLLYSTTPYKLGLPMAFKLYIKCEKLNKKEAVIYSL